MKFIKTATNKQNKKETTNFLSIPRGGVLQLHVGTSVRPSVSQSYVCPSVCFLFPDDNLSKCQGILIKFGTCIDMKEVGLKLLMGRVICQLHNNGGVL